jgi:outer membrane protein TolC
VAEEQRRKVVQTLMQDVRRAYWRAAGAQRLQRQVAAAISAAQGALPAARKVETEGLRSPIDSLRYQKSLLDLIRQLEGVQRLLGESKVELAQMINLPPGQNYAIAVPPETALRIQSVRLPVGAMEETALILNPDIREQSYQTRISADEARKALLRLLPGINLSFNPNYDSNSFLVNHQWYAGAAKLNGYLSNLLEAPVMIHRADEDAALSDVRREAVSMAVLAKVHISYLQYLSAATEYRWSTQESDVDNRLYEQISNRAATDTQSDLERVSAQVSAVFSELRRYQSYAEAQAALGRLYAALGIDPTPDHNDVLDVAGVGLAIRRAHAEHQSDRLAPSGSEAATPAGGTTTAGTPSDAAVSGGDGKS